MKWLPVSLLVLVLDQASKLLADAMLALHQPVLLIPSLAITKAYNAGLKVFEAGDSGK